MASPNREQDVCHAIILCATSEEARQTRVVFECNGCEITESSHDDRMRGHYIHMTNKRGVPLRIRLYTCRDMGSVATGICTMYLLMTYNPYWIIMVGVCAGNPARGVKLGDLVIANRVVDLNAGKLTENGLQRNIHTCTLDPNTSSQVTDLVGGLSKYFSDNKVWNTEVTASRPNSDSNRPEIYVGVVGTDASTVRSELTTERWTSLPGEVAQRHLYALEMEGYGLYSAVETYRQLVNPRTQTLLIKGVSDLATPEKDDSFHEYGKRIAPAFAYQFLVRRNFEESDPDKLRIIQLTTLLNSINSGIVAKLRAYAQQASTDNPEGEMVAPLYVSETSFRALGALAAKSNNYIKIGHGGTYYGSTINEVKPEDWQLEPYISVYHTVRVVIPYKAFK